MPGSALAEARLEAEKPLWDAGLPGRLRASLHRLQPDIRWRPCVPGRELSGRMHWQTMWIWMPDDPRAEELWAQAKRFAVEEMRAAPRGTAPICLQRLDERGHTHDVVVVRRSGASEEREPGSLRARVEPNALCGSVPGYEDNVIPLDAARSEGPGDTGGDPRTSA